MLKEETKTIPYTYLIGWTDLKVFYYGVQFGKYRNPDNLWKTYFTSSKHVKNFRKIHGEPNLIQIRRIFSSSEKAREWETKVIRKMNMVKSSEWLNKTDNTGKFYTEGKQPPRSKELIERIAAKHRGKKLTEAHKETLRKGFQEYKSTTKHIEAVKKASISNTGKKMSEEKRQNLKNAHAKRSTKEKSLNASKAGIKSSENYKNSPERQAAHKERMKLWWAERKKTKEVT